MPYIQTPDMNFYFEECGKGEPILFIHEMAGNYASWEPQMRRFARSNRCITYSARGYPPSTVPCDSSSYSQRQSASDAITVLDGLDISKAHIVGLSMGSFATVQLGIDHPERALSLTIVGCGSGSELAIHESRKKDYVAMSNLIRSEGLQRFVDEYGSGPYRQTFMRKDPRGWQEFRDRFLLNSAEGTADSLAQIQAKRPSLWHMHEEIKRITLPTLVVCGDKDLPCIQPSIFLSHTIENAQLHLFGDTGHAVNLEEPDLFNRILQGFLYDQR
ncbi:alpha/beta fold hydrolase [Pusillimonas sp. ANT_WB101]|uniref:alpha/beta fold hydrolase n=1 Tax=Pusillimonas sp. ANT_WB101 TaxID=2597356 RepID=UPI0011ED3A69|nr:alpha/beta hydrolase [Pusillimonas sp. ANT_WB101]KAA0910462.1 alpha/beta hydrolase [Pusillimonas sp. ANT_WB101]